MKFPNILDLTDLQTNEITHFHPFLHVTITSMFQLRD